MNVARVKFVDALYDWSRRTAVPVPAVGAASNDDVQEAGAVL